MGTINSKASKKKNSINKLNNQEANNHICNDVDCNNNNNNNNKNNDGNNDNNHVSNKSILNGLTSLQTSEDEEKEKEKTSNIKNNNETINSLNCNCNCKNTRLLSLKENKSTTNIENSSRQHKNSSTKKITMSSPNNKYVDLTDCQSSDQAHSSESRSSQSLTPTSHPFDDTNLNVKPIYAHQTSTSSENQQQQSKTKRNEFSKMKGVRFSEEVFTINPHDFTNETIQINDTKSTQDNKNKSEVSSAKVFSLIRMRRMTH